MDTFLYVIIGMLSIEVTVKILCLAVGHMPDASRWRWDRRPHRNSYLDLGNRTTDWSAEMTTLPTTNVTDRVRQSR